MGEAPFQVIEALARSGGYPAKKKRGFPILLRRLWSFEQGKIMIPESPQCTLRRSPYKGNLSAIVVKLTI